MGEKKRKRAAEEADAAVRPKKNRTTEPKPVELPTPEEPAQPTKKSSLSRQEKSERRSKKAKKAAEKVEEKDENGESAKERKSAELPTPPADDALVNGSDFVPLDGASTVSKSSKKPKKEKKEKKAKKSSKTEDDADVVEDASTPAPSKKDDRFICFIGNLPYNTTSAQVHSHFIKIADGIKSIRLPSDKKTGKGKGFAFLEFDGFDKMKTCLKLYHHSIFDPSVETEDKEAKPGQKETGKGRRINVDLTVGGGGAGKERKEKIHAKNQKLDEQRERAHIKEKEEAAKEGKKEKKEKKTTTGANGVMLIKEQVEDRGAIHPSRLNRVAR
jgi:nucleolar protein 6